MEIDYDILAQKIKEAITVPEKKVTGRAYWRKLRREKSQLTSNYIAPESAAPLVSRDLYEKLEREGRNYSYRERQHLRAILSEKELMGDL